MSEPKPALVKLMRQLSVEAKKGLLSDDLKTSIKEKVRYGFQPAPTASDSELPEQEEDLPLVPLLRQLSQCAQEGQNCFNFEQISETAGKRMPHLLFLVGVITPQLKRDIKG